MCKYLGRDVHVSRSNGTETSGKLVEVTSDYVMLMRDCEYYMIDNSEVAEIRVKL